MSPTSPVTSPERLDEPQPTNEPILPTTVIEGETISPTLAARLAMCTLGHVLYLKDQIPHPINQLAKLASRPDTSMVRNYRRRTEFLDAIDLLWCHLHTTFDELSRSFAKNSIRYPQLSADFGSQLRPNAQAQLLLALGPTVASARSRVIINLDDFEVKGYGQDAEWTDDDDKTSVVSDESEDVYYEDDLPPLVADGDVEATWSEDEASDDENACSPPLSYNEGILASQDAVYDRAERALSRAITSNDIFSTAMAPTNTFVLLRAPRCFNHPEWLPQPRFQKALDSHLARCKEGVCVRCHVPRITIPESTADSHLDGEDHELMWWMWTGKLVGFTHQ